MPGPISRVELEFDGKPVAVHEPEDSVNWLLVLFLDSNMQLRMVPCLDVVYK
ncbi:MAG: hypothetical protein HC901_00805 [Bdellovibrionaceae bacterium]|nr:hypothetical protein [Pseudobdellovibrionaceae bacterium]